MLSEKLDIDQVCPFCTDCRLPAKFKLVGICEFYSLGQKPMDNSESAPLNSSRNIVFFSILKFFTFLKFVESLGKY